jgi:kynureninase
MDVADRATTGRADAERADATDPLAPLRDRCQLPDPPLIYLDGNSLGMLPKRALARTHELLTREWGAGLIRSWQASWMALPRRVGDLLGEHLLGAAPGQVVVADSTSVNLYKLAAAALDARPGRGVILGDRHDFPSDRYILEGLASARGLELRLADFHETAGPTVEQIAALLDERTALVSLSQVNYRSGALADMAAINQAAHRAGALTLWDLCHSAGAVPVQLDASGADLAVGCTYKYLNGGPGAPAFLYVRHEHQAALRQPIWGWFGQRDQFAMAQGYDPVPEVTRFLVGTPPVLGLALVEEGVRLLAEAGIERLRAKGMALTSLLVELHDAWLAPLGFALASPRDPTRRGSHVALSHPDSARLCRTLIETSQVIGDFRQPDRLRLGLAPLTTRFVDVWDALDRLRRLVAGRADTSATATVPAGPGASKP